MKRASNPDDENVRMLTAFVSQYVLGDREYVLRHVDTLSRSESKGLVWLLLWWSQKAAITLANAKDIDLDEAIARIRDTADEGIRIAGEQP